MKDDFKRLSALQKDQSWSFFLGLFILRLVTCFRLLTGAIVRELGLREEDYGQLLPGGD